MTRGLRNILVCVTGATPQVVTETIFALSTKKPPIHVDELFVITTSYGKSYIKEKLLNQGILYKLINEYNLPPINFSEENIIVIRNKKGSVLDDIKDDTDSESAGDIITDFIRTMTDRPDTALHCSIAGGRKTMSFYLGAALQLFGRPQDKLYHVLVRAEFENNPEFFYPPKKPRRIKCMLPDGRTKLLSTKQAEIYLAELPFVRLKSRLWLEGKTFRELIEEAQESMSLYTLHRPVVIRLKDRRLFIGNTELSLPPMLIALYSAFAFQKTRGCKKPARNNCSGCSDCYIDADNLMNREFLKLIKKINTLLYGKQSSRLYDERWQRYEEKGGIPIDTIRQNISKINKHIATLIDDDPSFYQIKRVGSYGKSSYG
ncbi:MAG: TIGR02584 family CRISPR-associated protein, partial [Nitrospirae bacterium]